MANDENIDDSLLKYDAIKRIKIRGIVEKESFKCENYLKKNLLILSKTN